MLVQTLQCPAAVVLVGLELFISLGEDSAVSMLGKEDATHYHALCDSPSQVGEDIPL